jgi:hypothetical protein
MRRTLHGLCVGLAAFAAGAFAASSFERAVFVPEGLVAAPEVSEPRSAPAPHTKRCRLHGYEMTPVRSTGEGAAILYQKWEYAAKNSRGEHERRFPSCCEAVWTGERGEYGEVVQLYTCPGCVAAYIRWNKRYAATWR